MRIRNAKTISIFGAVAAVFVLHVSAGEAAPPRGTKKVTKPEAKSDAKLDTIAPAAPVPKHVPTKQELELEAKHQKFEMARAEAMKKRYTFPPKRETAKRSEARVRLERVVDGAAVISTPYPLEKESDLITSGFTKVNRAEDALDMALFGGRVFRMVQLAGGTKSDFERAAGREVVLSLETWHEGLVRATAVRPVR